VLRSPVLSALVEQEDEEWDGGDDDEGDAVRDDLEDHDALRE
jgi:hypothetical protein